LLGDRTVSEHCDDGFAVLGGAGQLGDLRRTAIQETLTAFWTAIPDSYVNSLVHQTLADG
jgi:hypothetical protein